MAAPDFVAVGHVTLDRFGRTVRPGGAALYAAVTAHRLGLSAGILTSHADDFPAELVPPQIEVVTVPAEATTTFVHGRSDGGRELRALSRARPLGAADLPGDWLDADLVLLAPVLDEVEPALAARLEDATLGAAAQGWLRTVGADAVVMSRGWTPPGWLLGRLQALFTSAEDIRGQERQALEWFQRVPLGVVTAGEVGAWLFVNGERHAVRPRPARAVDATGAGDVFAAALLVEYRTSGDPWAAAAAAACAASLSVEGPGWSTVPDREGLQAALGDYWRRE